MKIVTKVKENLPTGVTQNQIDTFCEENKDYIFHQKLDYPCQSGSGMRSKVTLRHKDSLVKTMTHPTIEASVELIGFDETEIQEKFENWCESI